MEKKVIYFEDLPVEEQVDVLFDSKQFWENFLKDSDDDCALETILKRNGITNRRLIRWIKIIGERQFKNRTEKYNLIFVD